MAQVVVVVRGNLKVFWYIALSRIAPFLLLSLHLAEVPCLAGDEQADNEAEEAQDRAEDLDNQDLDEERRVGGISQGCTTAVDAYSNTTDQIADAHGQTRPEQGEAGVVCLSVVKLLALNAVQLGREDDGHDDAVDGDDLAEDNGDEVLGSDTRGADTATDDRGSSDKDAPGKKQV